jgi:hypothetical protein
VTDRVHPSFEAFVAARGSALLRHAYVLTGDRFLAEDLVVHSWDWNGTSWAPGQDGVLRRTYPQGSPSVRLVKENASPGNNGRWIVESSPEVDLGPTAGELAVR